MRITYYKFLIKHLLYFLCTSLHKIYTVYSKIERYFNIYLIDMIAFLMAC